MSKLETNQVDPATGTTLTLGTSGDTIAIPSGVTIANSGTATGFGISGWSSSSGNLLSADASKGIYLGVNSATAANLLNDYEEGTWTPSYTGSTTGSVSYGSRGGTYTKIGNLVVAWFSLVNFTTTGSWAGDLKVTGLPFTCNQTNNVRICNGVCRFYNINTNTNTRFNVTMDVDSGQSYLIFIQSGDDTNWESIQVETTSTSYLEGTISYRTDS